MARSLSKAVEQPRVEADGKVMQLASQALSLVASRVSVDRATVSPTLLARLIAASIDPDHTIIARLIAEFRAARIRPETIVDAYIPEAARQMGEAWTQDILGFSDVTIGTARLQSLLREIAPRDSALRFDERLPASILIVVGEGETHTLGTKVLACQFRRFGASVWVSIGESAEDLHRCLQSRPFDMVAISVPNSERLEPARKLIEQVRCGLRHPAPVCVGGAAFGTGGASGTDVGADFVTNDPHEALRHCGLKISTPGTESGTPPP